MHFFIDIAQVLYIQRAAPNPATALVITRVQGHATRRDVERGRVRQEDKTGNDGADELAVQAALAQMPTSERLLQRGAARRRLRAMATQRMMLKILEHRLVAEDSAQCEVEQTMEYDQLLHRAEGDAEDVEYIAEGIGRRSIPVDAG